MITMWIVIFILSIAVLVKSSDYFIDNSKIIGRAFNIPDIVIGITIVAFGTSLPELITSILAVIQGQSEIVISNVVGSNIANIFLVFGVGVFLVGKNKIKEKIIIDIVVLMVMSVILYIFSMDGIISFYESLSILIAFAFYMFYLIKTVDKHRENGEIEIETEHDKTEKISIWKPLIILLLSSFGIYISSDFTIKAVVKISEISVIATDVISASAIALGTSLPELVVSIVSAKKGEINLIFGNVLGSNLFNIFSVIGVSGLIGNLTIPSSIMTISLPLMIIGAFVFSMNLLIGKINKIIGSTYVVIYVLFILRLYGVI